MKIPKTLLRFTLFSTSLTGIRCGSYSPPKPEYFSAVKFQTKEKSKLFSDCVKNIHVDTTDNKLRFQFVFDIKRDFPFPVIDSMKDTLTSTAFKFEFFSNGKTLTLDHAVIFTAKNQCISRYYWRGTEIDSAFIFQSDTASLKDMNSFEAVIPFYAFQNLKAGKQKIELKISQSRFCSEEEHIIRGWDETNQDSTYHRFKNYAEKSMISGTLSFKINVPSIYKTVLYGEGLQLQNDSAWTPFGMDETIWNMPFPDIYWIVYSPNEMYYAETPFEKTTTRYEGKDTFNIYHYHPSDSIGIAVYDHDWLSRDDWMGDCNVSLKNLQGDYSKELNFDHIKYFCAYTKTIGVINK